jgi:hypothetical protein
MGTLFESGPWDVDTGRAVFDKLASDKMWEIIIMLMNVYNSKVFLFASTKALYEKK